MSKVRHLCFDRILPSNLRRAIPFAAIGAGGRTRAISPIGKQWPNASTLRIRFLGGTTQQHNTVQQYAPQWTECANLTFVFDNALDAEIRIAFEDDGAWSYIGTDAQSIHTSQPTMNFGWLDQGVVLHEFGHAIALAHEHQNPDGGIRWNDANVIRDLSGPPNRWDVPTIRHNVLNKYTHDQLHGTAFDRDSIMLYSFPAEWTLDGFHTDPNNDLSPTDKEFIAGQVMYPGRGTQPDIVEIGVTEIKATDAAIGKPGEEDMFKFRAKAAGRYTIETEGSIDVMMKLYGPDSQTLLIAEDDDSGQGTNAKISADLSAGEYFVQIRHYNRTSGTGSYGMKVWK